MPGTHDLTPCLWERLLEGGKAHRCGWLCDRFGVTWQVVPKLLARLMQDAEPAHAARVMAAMQPMVKLDIAALQAAYDHAA